MKILDMFIDGMVEQFIQIDDDHVMNRNEWRVFCSSAVERNITKEELEKELAEIMGNKE